MAEKKATKKPQEKKSTSKKTDKKDERVTYAWEKYPEKDRKQVMDFAEKYRRFISENKTERECTSTIYADALEHGFVDLKDAIKAGKKLKAGDRIVANNMGKGLALFIVGQEPIESGMNILGAHIDSPRIDLKQVPLYEDAGTKFAMLDTHYYGGIKKYQWVTLPLALHGVVSKKDGSNVVINIGDKPSDPVFGVSDLLIHLSADQMSKKAAEVITGEGLDILIGTIAKESKDDEEKVANAVKANILDMLEKTYGIEEDDFLSAEIEVVPAGDARDYGFDRSMIMGYGHDDRVCAYPSYVAMLEMKKPKRTSVCLLVDKEEIGSVGASGMQSRFFENCVAEMIDLTDSYSELKVRRAMTNSKALSSDVSAAFDCNFPSVMEPRNSAYFARGLVFNKYTGSRGKSGSNDASSEFMAEVRKIMDGNKVVFQTAELGKVDQGGGGTIAYILGNYGMNVIDSGVPVLNMHAPWEIICKVDLYEAYLGYIAFLKEA